MSEIIRESMDYDVVIVGGGPAGLSAAIYGARAGLSPIVVQGMQPGGQLTITTDVENYPGFRDVIQGPWLMEQMRLQAEHVGTEMLMDIIESVDFSKRPFVSAILIGFIFHCLPVSSYTSYFFFVKQTVISSPTRCTFGIPLIFA